jgi:hypothetical protein
MRGQQPQWGNWDDGELDAYGAGEQQGYQHYYEDQQGASADEDDYYPTDGYQNDYNYGGYEDEERGLVLEPEQSLVNVSTTVTKHGAPLLSYTRTMQQFYNNRKQRLSLGRFKCEVCGARIRFWAWETPTKSRTHDGCYERLAWTWTNVYAVQQKLAAEGRLE